MVNTVEGKRWGEQEAAQSHALCSPSDRLTNGRAYRGAKSGWCYPGAGGQTVCAGSQGGEVLTRWHRVPIWPKAPQPPSRPRYPSTSIHYPAGFAFPGQCVSSKGTALVTGAQLGVSACWEASKEQKASSWHGDLSSSEFNSLSAIFFLGGGEKLTSGCVLNCVCSFELWLDFSQ